MFREELPGFANVSSMRVAGGLGTIPRIVSEGDEIYRGPLTLAEALSRIETIYRPYHRTLADLIAGRARSFRLCASGRLPLHALDSLHVM